MFPHIIYIRLFKGKNSANKYVPYLTIKNYYYKWLLFHNDIRYSIVGKFIEKYKTF